MSHTDFAHLLGERVKELTALHRTARILQDHRRPDADLMADIVALLPDAWQYPEVTAARIQYRGRSYQSPGFRETPWLQTATFGDAEGEGGDLAVAYLAPREPADEGPFLTEERDLIDSLADMLGAHLERRRADEALVAARESLAALVDERTADLRRLASQLTLNEARQRREIASDLHDHIGQALAHTKQRVRTLQGNAIFSGNAEDIEEILRLLDMTIQYTRELTSEISPPVLYALGLEPALDWLAEQMQRMQGFQVHLTAVGTARPLPEAHQVILYLAARELLANSARHSGASEASLAVEWADRTVSITVADSGRGFDPDLPLGRQLETGFGLFSVRERLRDLGGSATIDSAPGAGCTAVLRVPIQDRPAP
jgi:two-component system, NarL family, sensor kinase